MREMEVLVQRHTFSYEMNKFWLFTWVVMDVASFYCCCFNKDIELLNLYTVSLLVTIMEIMTSQMKALVG